MTKTASSTPEKQRTSSGSTPSWSEAISARSSGLPAAGV